MGKDGKKDIHVLLIESQHPLRTRLIASRKFRLAAVEPVVLVLLVPHQKGPQLALVILLDGIDVHD